MKIRENCYMLGLGSTGGKIYKEFVQRHYKGAAANVPSCLQLSVSTFCI